MFSKRHIVPQKLFVIRTYKKISEIESVVSNIAQKNNIPLQLSILGILTTNKTITKKEFQKNIDTIKQKLNAVLGKQFEFDYFHNPEIGCLFIAGHLAPTFLTKVDDRELASLPAGLLGIFRGLGINIENSTNYIAALKKENYCLIIRGESSVLATIEPMLNEF